MPGSKDIDTKKIISKVKESFNNDEIDNSLIELKKEMAWRIVDKMQEKKWDLMLWLWKDMVVDYLVDEWGLDSISDEIVVWKILDIFELSLEELTHLRDDISNTTTESDLQSLETRIIEQLDKGTTDEATTSQSETTSYQSSATWTALVAWTTWATTQWATSSEDNSLESKSLEDSAPVGEAKEIEKKQRMQRLFPEWVPQTEKEMKKYITKIKVPILTEKWKVKKLTLRVHKKLANEYIAIFEDMKNAWIKINPDTTACFNWRKMRKWSKMSHHSYWTAIDVNWDVNWWVYWKTDKNSPYFNDQATVEIRKKHGFYWWWDRSSKNNDPMHFTYMNA